MSIKIQDPLFLLSAQTGLSATELVAEAGEGNPDNLNSPQTALQTGEPIPIIFCRRRNSNGGVLVQPKMTEARFSNSLVNNVFRLGGVGTDRDATLFERYSIKYLLVLSEGNLAQLQIRDIFYGNSRKGTFNQTYDGRAGTWNAGNTISDYVSREISPDSNGEYNFDVTTLNDGETVLMGSTIYRKVNLLPQGYVYPSITYRERDFPTFTGTSGSYSGLTTLSFEVIQDLGEDQEVMKTVSVFVRGGLQVTRLVDEVSGPSDNFVDLVKYVFQANNRLAEDLIDNTALLRAANFTDTNGFFFNGSIAKSQNLLDWVQKTSANFLLQASSTNGKFGLRPRLPYNTDYTIKTTQVTPVYTFTEDHIVKDGFELEYVSLEDREPRCFVVSWRQQPEADFGLVRTVEVRYENEAENGPYINIDMSNYCTNEDHAVKIGTYRLAQRKFITHHLRITVRELNYNSLVTVGDIVRVRLRRETNEGAVEYHDKLYEVNRIDKTFQATIVYDLTHFPTDSLGRSIVAREVAAASGAGNVIDVGRNTFNGDVNSSTSTATVGTLSGGGGVDELGNSIVPPEGDTSVDIASPEDGLVDDDGNPILDSDGNQLPVTDSSYPGSVTINESNNWNNPDDSLDAPQAQPTVSGYTGTPGTGDTLSFSPGCEGAYIEWYKININTGDVTLIGSGVGATLEVTEALQTEGVQVYGVGRCPDPSDPSGYGPAVTSDTVDVFDEIISCPGGGDAGNQGTFTKVIDVGTAYPASFTFTYTAYTIPDRFVISGAATLDTGFVSGQNVNVNVNKTSSSRYITVTVYAPTSGTAWNYSVGCAS